MFAGLHVVGIGLQHAALRTNLNALELDCVAFTFLVLWSSFSRWLLAWRLISGQEVLMFRSKFSARHSF